VNVRVVNETHDPSLRSWVASANADGTDFPIQNLPFGVFRRAGTQEAFRGGVAIGDAILDLGALDDAAMFWGDPAAVLAVASRPPLNEFMALGHEATNVLRSALVRALSDGSPVRERLEPMLVPQLDAEMALPMQVGDYTDFYSSLYHATNVGRLFRPDRPLLENYDYLPIGYHGRASSIVVSGTPIVWPSGQRITQGMTTPTYGPSIRLDYEVELGIVIGKGNELGRPIPLSEAEEHIFGMCLLNDWSARDIQAWEYQPLGPFLGKSFATTISAWIVTLEALAPFRGTPGPNERTTLSYLSGDTDAFHISISALLAAHGNGTSAEPEKLSTVSYKRASQWTPAQLVAHQTSNGCNLRSGDVLGTGTLSADRPETWGCLLEKTRGGEAPLRLADGSHRTFLEAGDSVILEARCDHEHHALGFGRAEGTLVQRPV
jgi:fumarylacetoacetase